MKYFKSKDAFGLYSIVIESEGTPQGGRDLVEITKEEYDKLKSQLESRATLHVVSNEDGDSIG